MTMTMTMAMAMAMMVIINIALALFLHRSAAKACLISVDQHGLTTVPSTRRNVQVGYTQDQAHDTRGEGDDVWRLFPVGEQPPSPPMPATRRQTLVVRREKEGSTRCAQNPTPQTLKSDSRGWNPKPHAFDACQVTVDENSVLRIPSTLILKRMPDDC